MRYGPNIIDQICEELHKVPNIRYVCKKLGIHPSTFYRWMMNHHHFYKRVEGALVIGRDRMVDAAEGVIINGIQNGDTKCATYFLSHNSPRYSSREQAEYLSQINQSLMKIMEEPTPENDSSSSFDFYFDAYYRMEEFFGAKEALRRITVYTDALCHGDPELQKIFFVAYSDWKANQEASKRKEEAMRSLTKDKD